MVSVASSEPNWVVAAIISAVIGAFVSPFAGVVGFPLRRLRRHPLGGRWFSYHHTFMNGKPVLRYGTFRIRPGVRHPYVVLRRSSSEPVRPKFKVERPALRWSGSVHQEHDQFVMILKARSHKETMMYRTFARIPSNSAVIPVVWIGFDHDINPAVGLGILSRDPLDDETAVRTLKSWAVAESTVLRLRKDGG